MGLILIATGLAMMELIGGYMPIIRDNLVDKLERDQRETRNVIGNRAKRDAA